MWTRAQSELEVIGKNHFRENIRKTRKEKMWGNWLPEEKQKQYVITTPINPKANSNPLTYVRYFTARTPLQPSAQSHACEHIHRFLHILSLFTRNEIRLPTLKKSQ